ncbi:MAG TPA: ChaN family lipoprotein [Phycisphaerae bacterium]|nr:ChaN family lipoprotein [Phycisphaerae bacterium]
MSHSYRCRSTAATKPRLAGIFAIFLSLAGCTAGDRVNLLHRTGGSAALFEQFQAFDGRTGAAISFQDVVSRADRADVLLFGEEHSDIVCNALEAQLLSALSRQRRPITLAMEFFETDTQAALDAYLFGRISETEFREQTRQKRGYATTHRPLIEYCRAASIPVIAANTPRRLIRALRESGRPYDEFRADLDPADRSWLPRTSDLLDGPYYDRFVKAMADHAMPTSAPSSQPTSATSAPAASQPTTQPDREEQLLRAYRTQSLWDDTMAEWMAAHRRNYPERRVLLVVGAFHVAGGGGTAIKLHRRRPTDQALTIVYRGTSKTPLAFDEADRGAGDIVIYGVKPEDPPEPAKPPTTSAPTSAPATAPAPHSTGEKTSSNAPVDRV